MYERSDLRGLLLSSYHHWLSKLSFLLSYVLQDLGYFEHQFNVRPKPFIPGGQRRLLD